MMEARPQLLDLCSGIGGFSLAASWLGIETIGFCEIDPWCQRVLAKNFPGVPLHDDLRTLTGTVVRGWLGSVHGVVPHADGQRRRHQPQGSSTACVIGGIPQLRELTLITAGYPCQPFSHAGKRLGAEDDRHLWPHIARLVDELRPRYCLFENVAGHISLGLDDVLSDLEALGYACRPVVVPACAVNAPHRRDRVWIVAHAERGGRREQMRTNTAQGPFSSTVRREGASWTRPGGKAAADAAVITQREPADETKSIQTGGRTWQEFSDRGWWATEPDVGRVAHGIPKRVDRLRGLGNAIVPQIAYVILSSMLAAA